MTDEDHYTAI